MNEQEIIQYKAAKEAEFYYAFQELEKELSEKYSIDITISTHYNSLLINGINRELSPIINDVRNDIIAYAQKILNEEYKITLPNLAYISDDPNNIFSPTSNVSYSLERTLKEDEPQ